MRMVAHDDIGAGVGEPLADARDDVGAGEIEQIVIAALVEREAGSPDSAVALGLRALALGAGDSGIINRAAGATN